MSLEGVSGVWSTVTISCPSVAVHQSRSVTRSLSLWWALAFGRSVVGVAAGLCVGRTSAYLQLSGSLHFEGLLLALLVCLFRSVVVGATLPESVVCVAALFAGDAWLGFWRSPLMI